MAQSIDPEKSSIERDHRDYSLAMEVLIRVPYKPIGVSLKQIAKDIFKDEKKYLLIRRIVDKLKIEGYGVRIYINDSDLECVYLEDGRRFTRKHAKGVANKYDIALYSKHYLPKPQYAVDYKNTMPAKKKIKFKSWPGCFKIIHKKTKVIAYRSCVSGYTEESKEKHNETLRLKKELVDGNFIQDH